MATICCTEKKEWMVSLDTYLFTQIKEIEHEMEIIKQLAKADPTKRDSIYFKFNDKIQRKIHTTIAFALFFDHHDCPRKLSSNIMVNDICYDFFGINFETTLMICKDFNDSGILRMWNAIPKIKNNDKIITFGACTISSKKEILIIDDTKELITKTCTPNGKLLGKGYCREHENENNCNIPWYLIEIIVRYFNITLNHLHKLLRK